MVSNQRPLGRQSPNRRGTAVALVCVLLVPLCAFVAFGVDIGVICVSKAELQRTADAAALAAAWELVESQDPGSALTPMGAVLEARDAAKEYAGVNGVLTQQGIELGLADIDMGYAENPLQSLSLSRLDPSKYNVVRVTTRRDDKFNSPVPSFFARVFGYDNTHVKASATAAFINNVRGFSAPLNSDEKIPLLPFALDLGTWQDALAGVGPDNWRWDAASGQFVPGSDGLVEFNLYPQDTGSTANRGTVNIGTSANSTNHVARQIREGVSGDDLDYHGGEIAFTHARDLALGGDPGISAGFKDELKEIRGQPRAVPIFSGMSGSGNNSVYTIVEWGGVRIAYVQLTGKDKQVIVQAARVVSPGVLPGDDAGGASNGNSFITSTVWLAD